MKSPVLANYPASVQPETHNDLDVRDDWVRSAHSGLESPAFQRLQSSLVHRAGRTADELDISDGTVSQDPYGQKNRTGWKGEACSLD